MSENPERIWAEQPDIFDGMGIWHGAGDGPGAEYIRLDVHESAVAAARVEGMREGFLKAVAVVVNAGSKRSNRWVNRDEVLEGIRSLDEASK